VFKRILYSGLLLITGVNLLYSDHVYAESKAKQKFVMQLTRTAENYGHRRAMLQIDKILSDIGEDKLEIVVVAYENGIHALLSENSKTSQFLTRLANRGVSFKACRISMNAWGLTEKEFPLEVEFVPAGATEMIKLQMEGYKYWRP